MEEMMQFNVMVQVEAFGRPEDRVRIVKVIKDELQTRLGEAMVKEVVLLSDAVTPAVVRTISGGVPLRIQNWPRSVGHGSQLLAEDPE